MVGPLGVDPGTALSTHGPCANAGAIHLTDWEALVVGVQRLPKAVRCNDGLGRARSLGYDALIVFGIEDERANFRY